MFKILAHEVIVKITLMLGSLVYLIQILFDNKTDFIKSLLNKCVKEKKKMKFFEILCNEYINYSLGFTFGKVFM